MLLHDDVVYQILQWLPVMSLLRFKLVCRTWRALIESNNFIKRHLHLHHYDPSLKDKTHNLICLLPGKHSPIPFHSHITFQLSSIECFEEPNIFLQLNCSDSHRYFPVKVREIVSYNGIICLNLLNRDGKQSICLWNPATKQSTVLPQSPAVIRETKTNDLFTMVGVGFDVKNNDYQVVNLCNYSELNNEERAEVYSSNTDSWRSATDVIPFKGRFINPRMPFNNGTCFFRTTSPFESQRILCFDFRSRKFRLISFPNVDYVESNLFVSDVFFNSSLYASVVSDRIACVFNTNDRQTEIWVFNEYGSVNESWVKLHTIDFYSTINKRMSVEWLSMDGNYLFFRTRGDIFRTTIDPIIRYNVVKKTVKDWQSFRPRSNCSIGPLVEFKESLLSVGKGNNEWGN